MVVHTSVILAHRRLRKEINHKSQASSSCVVRPHLKIIVTLDKDYIVGDCWGDGTVGKVLEFDL